MWLSRFLVAFVLLEIVHCKSAFRLGAVLASTGSADAVEAKNGYEFYINELNSSNGGRGFYVGGRRGSAGYYFSYEFVWRDDYNDATIHATELDKLIHKDKVDFFGGSHEAFAFNDMKIINESSILGYFCCIGRDKYYEPNYPTVFGIFASDRQQTKLMIRTLSLRDIKGEMIIYDNSSEFTRATCEAAIEYTDEATTINAREGPKMIRKFDLEQIDSEYFRSAAAEAKAARVESVIACLHPDEGKQLVDAFHDLEHPLKAFFLTTGPTNQNWVDSFDLPERADDLLSSAQWHNTVNYEDQFFGSTQRYVKRYKQVYGGALPSPVTAAASAVGETLTMAIQSAFERCDISGTNGDVDQLLYNSKAIQCEWDELGSRGYDRVRNALAEMDVETFFGRVKFNYYRQNVGLDPVTTQVFVRNVKGEKKRMVESVLPLGYSTELMTFPATNYYIPTCLPGEFIGPDSFRKPCLPCGKGELSYSVNAHHCDSCPIGEWSDQKNQSRCQKCPKGTTTEIRGATRIEDCICKNGHYNANQESGKECQKCPHGATCEGGLAIPVVLPMFWANVSKIGYVYECESPNVCKGGAEAECIEGHTGRLCASCDDGYFNMFESCYRCMHPAVIITLTVVLLVGWYVLNVTVSRSVDSLEMILEWAQLANIIGDINLNWTPMLTTMFGVANFMDFDVDILEPSCLIKWGFKENFITQLLLPFVMSTMAAVGYLGSAAAYGLVKTGWVRYEGKRHNTLSIFFKVPNNKKELQMKWDATIATFLASVDVTYVTIAKYCLDVFKCEEIAGVWVMQADVSVECHTEEHRVLMGLAATGVVFYVVGYLLFIVYILCSLLHKQKFSDEVNLRRFGFIYEKFELDYCFTPALTIVRKLLFVLVVVFLNNPAFKVGALAIVINGSLVFHIYAAPYVDTYMDVLFSFLLMSLMSEAFGGLMFYSENLPSANRSILEWIVLTSLLLLSIVFVTICSMEILGKYQTRWIREEHKKFARKGRGFMYPFFSLNKWRSRNKSISTSTPEKPNSPRPSPSLFNNRNFGLHDTFKPAFVYRTLQNKPNFIAEWDKLSKMLSRHMSDQSPTSYLSLDPIAKFWRKLVNRFPEVVDFLAVTDRHTRRQFNHIATGLFRDFYLRNKVTPLPIKSIINWRDHAPMAHWLAIAPEADRRFFIEVLVEMFKTNGFVKVADLLLKSLGQPSTEISLTKLRELSKERNLSFRQSFDSIMFNGRKEKIMQRMTSGKQPFESPWQDAPAVVLVSATSGGSAMSSRCNSFAMSSGSQLPKVAEVDYHSEDCHENLHPESENESNRERSFRD